jgi:hypothetical protein
MKFGSLYELLEIFIRKKSKKGKPWNNTGLFWAQGLSLRGLVARGRLQA